ncbi:amidase [Siminovitchia sediminis]|uniref:Amidase n=1 Tax=Siminovitchia sediminis TaxID=1274353 RepID=A0ABW4KIQ3_9BACI
MNKILEKDFLNGDISALGNAYQTKEITPTEVTRMILERISMDDTNSYITVTADEAMAQAEQAEIEMKQGNNKGPLHGVPMAIKDNIDTQGIPTTKGSAIYKDYLPDRDATVARKLKEAGAVILGKLNMHEFAYGTTGDRSFAGPVKNPHNLNKISGGSSSGSGAAVAASLCYAALGTDTGGSIRIPSSYNGLVGMKPTFGRVSNFGVFPLCWTLDHVGPMTRSVRDNALLMNVLAGFDDQDPYSAKEPLDDYTSLIEAGVEGNIIGIPSGDFFSGGDPQVERNYQQAIDIYKEEKAVIKTVDLPDMEEVLAAFRTILSSEAYTLHEHRLNGNAGLWDEEVRTRLLKAKEMYAKDYILAQLIKRKAIRAFEKLFKEVEVLLIPTVPILPVNIGQRETKLKGSSIHISFMLNRYTGPFNLTGLPSITVPSGKSIEGLPLGIQLVGKPFDEANMYRFAAVLEQEINLQR